MDLDNLGPIALFIVYMAISAWSKQKKARQRTSLNEKPGVKASSPISKPMQRVGGILDQLKKELFEIDEEPLVFQQAVPEYEDGVDSDIQEVVPEPKYSEGSPEHKHDHPLLRVVDFKEHVAAGQSLEAVLEPYSRLEQGIILHELLGKPKAYLRNDEWFHKS